MFNNDDMWLQTCILFSWNWKKCLIPLACEKIVHRIGAEVIVAPLAKYTKYEKC